VTTSILLALTLFTPFPPAPATPGPLGGVVEPRTGAWAVVHAGQLWVCWREHRGCFRRVEFDDDPRARDEIELELDDVVEDDFLTDEVEGELDYGPERWRLGFDSASHLWIEIDDRRYRVEVGHARARPAADASVVALGRPRTFDCGPGGRRPAIVAGQLDWQAAPRCAPPPSISTCVDTSVRPRPRKPSPVRLRAGFEVAVPRGWASADFDVASPTVARVQPRAALELSFVIELGFDPTRAADSRARAALLAHSRLRAVSMPPPGPLADAERRALLAAACGGDR
jgi:hypothetical protein